MRWAGLRDRVVSAAAPRVAAQYALQRQPESLQGAVFAESLKGILRASRSEAAGRRLQRRDAFAIEEDERDERGAQHFAHEAPYIGEGAHSDAPSCVSAGVPSRRRISATSARIV